MKALIIGASGQLGTTLSSALKRAGFDVVGTHHSHPGQETAPLDVRDPAAVRQCLEAVKPGIVFWTVNNAGGVDYCEGHPDLARAILVQGARNVVEACAGCGARLVYYSTDYVFDGASGPYGEEDEPRPLNVYGKAVLEGEKLISGSCAKSLILRTTAVYSWNRQSKNFAMQVWERLQAGNPMRVASDQIGNPTFVDYLAEASVRLVQLGADGLFNVVGKDLSARSELGKALARAMALDPELIEPVPTTELGQAAPRPLRGGLKTGKLAGILKTAPWDLQESLDRFRRCYEEFLTLKT